jgi:xanthine/CO dehydrogenase XdhC/CoxF family maturation factor
MDEVYREIARSLREGTPLAVATVATTRGSTPRKPGARMAIRPDGSFCGTIGGGCGEAEVRSVAMEVLETGQPRLVTVDLTDPIEGEDRICGGVMEVFIERIAAGGSRRPVAWSPSRGCVSPPRRRP